MNLNGEWQYRTGNGSWCPCILPGVTLAPDACMPVAFRRKVLLPQKTFDRLLLVLNGARFCPEIYINGQWVAQSEGGMCRTRYLIRHPACSPGAEIELEIRLKSLEDVPETDASRIPEADRWRSNISSCIWDDIHLYFVGNPAVTEVIPGFGDGRAEAVLVAEGEGETEARLCLQDGAGCVLETRTVRVCAGRTAVSFSAPLACWTPETPVLYTLQVSVGENVTEVRVPNRRFSVSGRDLLLNGEKIYLRGTSVVWHRFCRDPEGRQLAFDMPWFHAAVTGRLKRMGANFLRFHLGPPPEKLLDECDRVGLCVQLEWIFFHGCKASPESMVRQWKALFTLAARHPSVCILHLWNETSGEELARAYQALNVLEESFRGFVIAHRDTVHIHKYWWSLFENLNLSYDGMDDFDRPAVVDEFGGNYLDGALEPGLYPEAAEAFERFLGHDHTAAERNELQVLSTVRVGEYWRRLSAAAVAPFCALSSREDGNSWFLGKLSDNRPKDVFNACAVLFAPVCVSLNLWDRAFRAGEQTEAEVCLINDTAREQRVEWRTCVTDETGLSISGRKRISRLPAYARSVETARFALPSSGTKAVLSAECLFPPRSASQWPVRLTAASESEVLNGIRYRPLDENEELCAFCEACGMIRDEENPDLLTGGQDALEAISENPELRAEAEALMNRGCGLFLTDVGPRLLGEGYIRQKKEIRPDGTNDRNLKRSWVYSLPYSVKIRFDETAEAESCIHPAAGYEGIWPGKGALQLSNGLRGGLNAPAAVMEAEAMTGTETEEMWIRRGADRALLSSPTATAYCLEGFYAFSDSPSAAAEERLRNRVRFLVQDAPSLEGSIDPEAEIRVIPLAGTLRQEEEAGCTAEPVAVCSRGLKRTCVLKIRQADGAGTTVISQILSKGRLMKGNGPVFARDAHEDPEIRILIRNLMAEAIRKT